MEATYTKEFSMQRLPRLFVFLPVLAGLGCGPSVNVSARVVDDRVVFDIKPRGINKIYGLTVEDEAGNTIWDVNDPNMYSHQPVVYGALPPGAGEHEKVGQTFPADN